MSNFKRKTNLENVNKTSKWDIVIIGGGATGLGIAVDAASRGFKTLLLEKYDFAKATSSRSTKLVHGGVRYLANGDIKLVYSALHERGLIFQNAPHLAKIQSFIIPCYTFFSKWKYLIGLKIYDWMAGAYRIGTSRFLSSSQVVAKLHAVKQDNLKGGIIYYDGQFDDSRFAINLAQTANSLDATILNYCDVNAIHKDTNGQVCGVSFTDLESNQNFEVKAKTVINATGIFVDDILKLESPVHKNLVRPSQGTHIVIDKKFLGEEDALMIPETNDGRVLFGVPWHDHILLGTTDTPLDIHTIEPRPLEEEVDFILETAKNYLNPAPTRADILSVFAGLRPLAAPDESNPASTKEISRDHKLISSKSGLITITGGKWTTYRKMAEDTVNKAIQIGKLNTAPCITKTLKIHGYLQEKQQGHWQIYGSDAKLIQELAQKDPNLSQKIHPKFDYIAAEVVWAVRNEMARCLEDVLARRIRMLFLDAKAAMEAAPLVVQIMSKELEQSKTWEEEQLAQFLILCKNYTYNS
ncbi:MULTISPECIES: glycerol-3-phosphate dehydrogenase/oxidase [unclassified Sphingobacterium]|uniref:glycerol-3-phosphate dehydrogenase/oxidase n=1 Tax=unclassified Sphingobacterium TaxID=2609468 RepID=UPI00104D42B3|nr:MULTISPECIES: glycerol-3-phosphate dehydrogenase/oxidase [unclassified Sphingobacterium]MCS3554384.1 glycerol-3-phosphate dehydrogenase [Sphingobacterium sp. JUb21]TCR07375.1 glycerol-3-phosphate dehydrogenase [Sphingobacterium sp. JUb20]